MRTNYGFYLRSLTEKYKNIEINSNRFIYLLYIHICNLWFVYLIKYGKNKNIFQAYKQNIFLRLWLSVNPSQLHIVKLPNLLIFAFLDWEYEFVRKIQTQIKINIRYLMKSNRETITRTVTN